MAFVKLDCGILDSSLWRESIETKIVFITMLAMADSTGLCRATAPGISGRSGATLELTREALNRLESPDPDSRTRENDGRRILRVDGGYEILNYEKYREYDHSNADRQARFRAKRKADGNALQDGCNALPSASASVFVSSEKEKSPEKGENSHLGVGWSTNRVAIHLAQRWEAQNARGLCDPAKASHHFQAGLDAGIDPHALERAISENKGHLPYKIVDALKPKIQPVGRVEPKNSYEDKIRKAGG